MNAGLRIAVISVIAFQAILRTELERAICNPAASTEMRPRLRSRFSMMRRESH
jgi:hypothetical protein